MLEGFPKDFAASDLSEGSVTLTVDVAVYPLEAVYGAAYIFIDRCYVLLDCPKADQVSVTLADKKGAADAEALRPSGARGTPLERQTQLLNVIYSKPSKKTW